MKITLFLFLILNTSLFAQKNISITETVEDYQIEGILSASGIEVINHITYIVSDNQNVLFVKDKKSIKAIPLNGNETSDKINKTIKKDFESLCHIQYKKYNYLMIVSSGSVKDNRDTIFVLDTKTQKLTYKKNVRELYNLIQTKMGIKEGQLINIEASTSTSQYIFMFHRGNESGQNYMIQFPKDELIEYLIGENKTPQFSISTIDPPIRENLKNKVLPGISGAYTISDNELLITYSMEMTNSNYHDGEIIGSYFGILNLLNSKITSAFFPDKQDQNKLRVIKIEGIVLNRKTKSHYQISVVSDNDNGFSQFIKMDTVFQ